MVLLHAFFLTDDAEVVLGIGQLVRAGLRSKFLIPKTCELVGIHTQIQKKITKELLLKLYKTL